MVDGEWAPSSSAISRVHTHNQSNSNVYCIVVSWEYFTECNICILLVISRLPGLCLLCRTQYFIQTLTVIYFYLLKYTDVFWLCKFNWRWEDMPWHVHVLDCCITLRQRILSLLTWIYCTSLLLSWISLTARLREWTNPTASPLTNCTPSLSAGTRLTNLVTLVDQSSSFTWNTNQLPHALPSPLANPTASLASPTNPAPRLWRWPVKCWHITGDVVLPAEKRLCSPEVTCTRYCRAPEWTLLGICDMSWAWPTFRENFILTI